MTPPPESGKLPPMIVGIGIDSVAIARIEALYQRGGDRFLARIFTPGAHLLPGAAPPG